MMYGNKLAAAIKVNGKVLREFKDTVYIPFSAEYTILVKNLETKRVIVNVYIDGENVVPGGLVLNAGQEVDLERSIVNSNLSEGNRFKFIERTGAVEQHRGIKLEDGLIRIEYQFEKVQPQIRWQDYQTFNNNIPNWPKYTSGSYNVNGVMRSADFSNGEATKAVATSAINATLQSMNISSSTGEVHDGAATMDWMDAEMPRSMNDVGITVPGSKSEQKFTIAGWFPTELEKYNLVFKLVGDLGNKPVEKAVTVKHKPKCVTCGTQNKHSAKFCTECGTALEIFA